MKILSLNMNMSNYDIDDSFYVYLKEIDPDIAIIQECRYKRVNNDYKIILPKRFSKGTVDNRVHLTLALSKYDDYIREDIDLLKSFDYKFLKIINKNSDISLTAVHIPLMKDNKQGEYNDLLSAIARNESKIICGDFNASSKRKESENYRFLEKLITQEGYVDLWSKGIETNKAFYINYRGEIIEADKNKFYRTFVGNTHIDYTLGKDKLINLKKIIIDTRTLAFTDHCSIIVEIR